MRAGASNGTWAIFGHVARARLGALRFAPQVQAGLRVGQATQHQVVEDLEDELEREHPAREQRAAEELDPIVALAAQGDARLHVHLSALLRDVAAKREQLERGVEAAWRTRAAGALIVLAEHHLLERADPAQLGGAHVMEATDLGDPFENIDAALEAADQAPSETALRDNRHARGLYHACDELERARAALALA